MYVAQYRWSAGLAPVNIVVSEANKKMLLLSGGKIYSITLK